MDLGGLKKVTGFATQGKMDWLRDSWVTNLDVMSSRDSVNWYKEFYGQVNYTVITWRVSSYHVKEFYCVDVAGKLVT